ncbi:MAG: glycoside hydrolase family 9 protein [Paludibacteraceae bacterium]|nr:glycoside hydrolase family 9 protein [Paludibacteraceae bacterium]
MKMIKYVCSAATVALLNLLPITAQTPSFDKEQYQKALWMTTRFYGAQRSGVGPNWLLATHEPTDVPSALQGNLSAFKKGQSFVKDADGSYDLTGGWFDCGDHVKFGQTEFYSAYMLLLGYSEFPAGYDDYYSFDYNGYITADDYTWEGKKGKPNGIPDVLDEVKYATDYLLKCVRDKSTFYYQVGDGAVDHNHWVTASVMATLSKSEGGEAGGSRAFSKATGGVTSMAALCGSALAVMARVYKPFDPEYAQMCLEKALVAYDFVNGTSKGNSSAGGFYGAKPKYVEDLVIFNAELYRTTGDEKYLKEAENNSTWMETEAGYNYNYSLCYNNTADLACYLMATFKNSSYASYAMQAMDFYVNTMYKPASGYLLNKKKGSWGVLRFPANQAFVYGLYEKLNGNLTKVNQYSLTTIEYIMGKNSGSLSYITGFGEKSPTYVHHRNYYRSDADKETGVKLQSKFRQFGYLVGGSLDGSYSDVPGADYTYSEGGIDYNAGLVGALAYINSILNPVNVNKFGHPTPDLGEAQSICGLSSIKLDSKVAAAGQRTFTWYKDGVKVASSTSATTYEAKEAGIYSCVIDSAGEWETSGEVEILAALPTFDIPSEYELCDPAYVTFDFSLGEIPATYTWYKDDNEITGENTSILKVTKPGAYRCEIAVSNCASQRLEMNVTSLLPVIADAVSDSNGNVTLKAEGDGEYEWYADESVMTPLYKGSTFTTKIDKDTWFYVQDAGQMSLTSGPTAKSFTGTGVNWGNIGANFTTSKALKITSITVGIQSVYNAGNTTLTAELTHGASKKTFTSDAANVSAAGYVTFTFSNPIELTEVGDYSLKCSSGSFAINFFENGPAYSTYENAGNPITFTGATQGNAANGAFPALVDWKLETGSGCARALVLAKKGESSGCPTEVSAVCAVFPNPVVDQLTLDFSCGLSQGRVSVKLYDAVGSVVLNEILPASAQKETFNLSSLNQGIYLLQVVNGDEVYTQKIVKK